MSTSPLFSLSRYPQPGAIFELSDLSQVTAAQDISRFWMDISGDYRWKNAIR